MTMHVRVLSSLVRITDSNTAARLCDRVFFDVRKLEGNTVAYHDPSTAIPGIAISSDWIEQTDDETLDWVLAHELSHLAHSKNGADVMIALANGRLFKPKHMPAAMRDAYNLAIDHVMEGEIKTQMFTIVPAGSIYDVISQD